MEFILQNHPNLLGRFLKLEIMAPKRDGTKSVGKSPSYGWGWLGFPEDEFSESLQVIHSPPWKNLGWRVGNKIPSKPSKRPFFDLNPKRHSFYKDKVGLFPHFPSTWTPPGYNKNPPVFPSQFHTSNGSYPARWALQNPPFWKSGAGFASGFRLGVCWEDHHHQEWRSNPNAVRIKESHRNLQKFHWPTGCLEDLAPCLVSG